jgi:Rrf2 family protein
MRLITKETDYAIRAVINLAKKPGRFVPSGEISAEDGIPLQFLRRILQRLLKAGLVTSREGVAGGVSLKAVPEKIRVLDIVNVFQGQVALSECMFRRRICANRGTCVLRKRIKEIEGSLTAQFAGISIADLLRGQACKPAGSKATVAGRSSRSANKKRGVQ